MKASTCSRRIASTAVGMPCASRKSAIRSTADVYVAIVAGLTLRATSDRRQEGRRDRIPAVPVVSCGLSTDLETDTKTASAGSGDGDQHAVFERCRSTGSGEE